MAKCRVWEAREGIQARVTEEGMAVLWLMAGLRWDEAVVGEHAGEEVAGILQSGVVALGKLCSCHLPSKEAAANTKIAMARMTAIGGGMADPKVGVVVLIVGKALGVKENGLILSLGPSVIPGEPECHRGINFVFC